MTAPKKTAQYPEAEQSPSVPGIEKDIEKDKDAAAELAEKAARVRVKPTGVPVLDVKGKLILGFDQPAIEAALN